MECREEIRLQVSNGRAAIALSLNCLGNRLQYSFPHFCCKSFCFCRGVFLGKFSLRVGQYVRPSCARSSQELLVDRMWDTAFCLFTLMEYPFAVRVRFLHWVPRYVARQVEVAIRSLPFRCFRCQWNGKGNFLEPKVLSHFSPS